MMAQNASCCGWPARHICVQRDGAEPGRACRFWVLCGTGARPPACTAQLAGMLLRLPAVPTRMLATPGTKNRHCAAAAAQARSTPHTKSAQQRIHKSSPLVCIPDAIHGHQCGCIIRRADRPLHRRPPLHLHACKAMQGARLSMLRCSAGIATCPPTCPLQPLWRFAVVPQQRAAASQQQGSRCLGCRHQCCIQRSREARPRCSRLLHLLPRRL